MDGKQFDALARLVGEPTDRRLAVRSFTGGTLGAVLALIGVVPGPEEAAAHNKFKKCKKLKGRKKKACLKKAKKHAAQHANETPPPPQGDQAPPCTADFCPLPPECSQMDLEACTESLEASWLAEAEPCRDACRDPEAVECRACLAPIVEGWKAGAEACVAEACNFPASARPAPRQLSAKRERKASTARPNDQITAEAWWQRKCDKPCCYADVVEQSEDARDEWGVCMASAVASCFFSGPLCGGAALVCMAKLAYDTARWEARFGCVNGGSCQEGDVCCDDSFDQMCNGRCCHVSPGQQLSDVCCKGPSGGLTCCTNGASCCNGYCLGDAGGPWTPCGSGCCDPDHECCLGHCHPKDQGTWTECPMPSWTDRCCDGSEVCCNGSCREIAAGPWIECGDSCCNPEHECCNGNCYSIVGSPWTVCGDHCCERGTRCDDENHCTIA